LWMLIGVYEDEINFNVDQDVKAFESQIVPEIREVMEQFDAMRFCIFQQASDVWEVTLGGYN